MSAVVPLLEARDVSKAYPGVQALADVSLKLFPGELLAVVGENGAGKSTMMKILAGLERPDAGDLLWEGHSLHIPGVLAAERQGIVLIHQELNLASNLDVAASIFLGREPTWGGPLRLLNRSIYPEAAKLLARVGLAVPPTANVGELAVGQQQLVEIARALALRSRVLIMDEPTSSLTESETRTLYAVIGQLKAEGVSILYISHRLKEVEYLADRAVVLRDGRCAGELSRSEMQADRLIRLMVGRDLQQLHPRTHPAAGNRTATPLLKVDRLRWNAKQPAEGVSLNVHPGEIVGLAGLVGAGRTELAETIFGVRPILSGRLLLDGRSYLPRSPQRALRAGVFLVPEDRRLEGLILTDSVRGNISLASLNLLSHLGFVTGFRERVVAREQVNRLNIRTPSIEKLVGLLSGGNQQKVVLAKGLVRRPRLLLLDEPTRGVDIGAKAEIYSIMDRLAGEGVGILMISSDLEEVLGMSDRVAVLYEGRLAGELVRNELTEEAVMRLATGRQAA